MSNVLLEIENLLRHVDGINDERDSVPLLLGIRERWPLAKADLVEKACQLIEALAATQSSTFGCEPYAKKKLIDAAEIVRSTLLADK